MLQNNEAASGWFLPSAVTFQLQQPSYMDIFSYKGCRWKSASSTFLPWGESRVRFPGSIPGFEARSTMLSSASLSPSSSILIPGEQVPYLQCRSSGWDLSKQAFQDACFEDGIQVYYSRRSLQSKRRKIKGFICLLRPPS